MNKALISQASIRKETEGLANMKSVRWELSNDFASKTKDYYLFIPNLTKS